MLNRADRRRFGLLPECARALVSRSHGNTPAESNFGRQGA